ncbi:hypothetical protein [Nonomuraea sp. SYSU D8015]|uniref:hypothetical protein n=1 Tax=Nonomuraea sp. SYSU D8015 TaxID=2593644 RepID=UPI00166111D3|nr:hypothetical protein [Nonomuraea sp. SYSU D8015]
MAVTQARGRAYPISGGNGSKWLTLDLPMLSIEVRPPEMRMPHLEVVPKPRVPMPHIGRQELGRYADVARRFVPPPERIAYYGALGALAVFGVLEWPVAAAIGAGTMVAQRQGRGEEPEPSGPGQTQAREPSAARPAPAKPATTTARGRAAAGGRRTTTKRTSK